MIYCQLVGEGGFKSRQTVLAHPDERCSNGLVCSTFGGESDTRWCANQNETRVLITGVIQRIEAAADKGVIDGANWDQSLAEQGMRQTRRSQEAT